MPPRRRPSLTSLLDNDERNPLHIHDLPPELLLLIISHLTLPRDLPALISSSPRILQIYLAHRNSILLTLANTHTPPRIWRQRTGKSHISFSTIQYLLEKTDRWDKTNLAAYRKRVRSPFPVPDRTYTPAERLIADNWPRCVKRYYYHGRPDGDGVWRKMWDMGMDGGARGIRSQMREFFEGGDGKRWEEPPRVVFIGGKVRLWKVLMYIEAVGGEFSKYNAFRWAGLLGAWIIC